MKLASKDAVPELSSRPVLAKILGINPITIARAERDQRLKGFRPNRRSVLYRRQDVLEWLGIA